MEKGSKIYIAGHTGLVGSAIMEYLTAQGYSNIIFRTHNELDLTRQSETEDFFLSEKPEYVFLAAAKVGGILANSTYKADFIHDNMSIALNIIHSSYRSKVKKLINLGSSCIYPKFAPQPIKEESLLTDSLEETNEPYAIAKIAAIKLCHYYNCQYGTDFISAMPCNLYGTNDNFDLQNSHVLPAMVRKFHEAKVKNKPFVELWGDGSPEREFLYSSDLAEALCFLMNTVSAHRIGEHINIGAGKDISIKSLSNLIKDIVGFTGTVKWDTNKPNGTPKKLMDVSRMQQLGWEAKVSLQVGIEKTYKWFLENHTQHD